MRETQDERNQFFFWPNSISKIASSIWCYYSINSTFRCLVSTVPADTAFYFFSCRDPDALTQREDTEARVNAAKGKSHPTQFATLCRTPAWQGCADFITRVTLRRSPAGQPTKFGIDLAVESRVRVLHWHWMHHSIAKHDLDCASAATSRSRNYNSIPLSCTTVRCHYPHPGYKYNKCSKIIKFLMRQNSRWINEAPHNFKKLIMWLPKAMQTCNLATRTHAIEVRRMTGS